MALDDYNCAVCSLGIEETLLHLFLECPFAVNCWATLGLIIQESTYKSLSNNHLFQKLVSHSFLYGGHYFYVLGYLAGSK